jgi:hypothetical protein
MSFYFFLQILSLTNIIEIYVGKESTEGRFKDILSMVSWFICRFKLLFISGFVGFCFSFLRFLILLYEALFVRNDNYYLFFHYQYQKYRLFDILLESTQRLKWLCCNCGSYKSFFAIN